MPGPDSADTPTRQQRSVETRQAIFDAGAKLFARKGYAATGVREIAAAAGINQAMVAYHFGSKSGLYDEIIGEAAAHAAEMARGIDLDAAAGNAERELVRIFATAMASRPHLVPMVLREQLDPDHSLTQAKPRLLGFMALTERVLESIPLREGAQHYDPQVVHLICVGPLIHFIVACRVREATAAASGGQLSAPSLEEMVETLGDMLAHALRPQGGPKKLNT